MQITELGNCANKELKATTKTNKMTQQEDIKALYKCVEGLAEAMEAAAKSRDIMLNLMQFEGHRIDSLENKIDLLMRERVKYNDIQQGR